MRYAFCRVAWLGSRDPFWNFGPLYNFGTFIAIGTSYLADMPNRTSTSHSMTDYSWRRESCISIPSAENLSLSRQVRPCVEYPVGSSPEASPAWINRGGTEEEHRRGEAQRTISGGGFFGRGSQPPPHQLGACKLPQRGRGSGFLAFCSTRLPLLAPQYVLHTVCDVQIHALSPSP